MRRIAQNLVTVASSLSPILAPLVVLHILISLLLFVKFWLIIEISLLELEFLSITQSIDETFIGARAPDYESRSRLIIFYEDRATGRRFMREYKTY